MEINEGGKKKEKKKRLPILNLKSVGHTHYLDMQVLLI
jgi:hypothetical protein